MIYPRCANCGKGRGKHGAANLGCPIGNTGFFSAATAYRPKRPLSSVRTASPKRKARPAKKRKTKRASLSREADRLWSLLVRARGASEISGDTKNLQGAHGFPRTYRATRWLLINGFALTQSEHVFYTYRPLQWDQFLRERWGQPVYDELRRIALKNEKQDMVAVVSSLRAECETRGIDG